MNYLLKNLKPIACGEDFEAGKDELVFNPEGTFKMAELRAVAKANKIEHPAKAKMGELVPLIYAHFATLNLKETINIKSIVLAGIKAGKTDNEIMQKLVDAGVPIRDAWGQFRAALMGAGLLLNPTERATKLAELLEGFEPVTGFDVSTKLKELMEAVPRTTERQGMAAIRKFAEANSIELPKVHKLGGWKKKLTDWIVANPTASVGELGEYVAGLGRPDTITKRYTETMLLANRIAERFSLLA